MMSEVDMIYYVNDQNIDSRVLNKAKQIIENGGIVACPTDTNFSIFCSPLSKRGIEKLKKLKGNNDSFTFTLFCYSISQISDYAELNNRNFKYIKHYTPGPFVFILPALQSTEKKINMKRKEIGVRITESTIVIELLKTLENPLFGITASKEMSNSNWWDAVFADEHLFEFGWELEDITDLDIIIDNDNGIEHSKILSTVVDLTKDEVIVLREGFYPFTE